MEATLEVGAFSVVDVMRTEIFTLTPETPVTAARRLAREKRADHLLVLEGGVLAGIVCQDDLRANSESAVVAECMSSPVLCVGPETTLSDAAEIMVEQGVSCLPVVIGTSLVGLVTRAALAGIGIGVPPEGPRQEVDDRCAACGTTEGVSADARLQDVGMCGRCAAWVPGHRGDARPTG